jgi:hypothetical protein
LAKVALSRTVPVARSTVLSTNESSPVSAFSALPASETTGAPGAAGATGSREGRATTESLDSACALRIASNSASGTVKDTAIGRIWLMVTSVRSSLGRSMLPAWTWMLPVRPAIGATIRV